MSKHVSFTHVHVRWRLAGRYRRRPLADKAFQREGNPPPQRITSNHQRLVTVYMLLRPTTPPQSVYVAQPCSSRPSAAVQISGSGGVCARPRRPGTIHRALQFPMLCSGEVWTCGVAHWSSSCMFAVATLAADFAPDCDTVQC